MYNIYNIWYLDNERNNNMSMAQDVKKLQKRKRGN